MKIRSLLCVLVLGLAAFGVTHLLDAETGNTGTYTAALDPQNSFKFFVLQGEQPILKMEFMEWGDSNVWCYGPNSRQSLTDGKVSLSAPGMFGKDKPLIHTVEMSASGNSLTWQGGLEAKETDISFVLLVAAFHFPGKKEGTVTLVASDGKKTEVALPLPEAKYPNISSIELQVSGSEKIDMVLGAPTQIMAHTGSLYLCMGGNGWNIPSEVMKAGSKKELSIKLGFPGKVSLAGPEAFTKSLADEKWFVFNPTTWPSESAIVMDDWMEKPAGKHGKVKTIGDRFEFEDGTALKIWGVTGNFAPNLAPAKQDAEAMAAFWSSHGINSLRMFDIGLPAWRGIGTADDALEYDPALLDRFDYFTSQLTKQGIYYRFVPFWGFRVLPKNQDQVLNYQEIVTWGTKHTLGTIGLANIAEDIQDLMIKKAVKLLTHVNPYTNLSYAQDPALGCLELQNEDDIFWFALTQACQFAPSYAKKLNERFASWLKKRYHSQDGLKKAWGSALGSESLDSGAILADTVVWKYGMEHQKKISGNKDLVRRLLDNALFFHELQNEFYEKFTKAVRETGYKGPIVAGNWQAIEMIPHYYNLLSDAKIGQIDRHNYFGKGIWANMVSAPGSGILSAGVQQVMGVPFGLSEWSEVYPAAYGAEAPPIVAAYGMGLQGWAVSHQHHSAVCNVTPPTWAKGWNLAYLSPMHTMAGSPPWALWVVNTPTQIGQYPLLTRMLYRGDVKTGDVISTRRVSLKDLENGTFSFVEDYAQEGDIKNFSKTSTVPPAALAAGRCLIQFTDKSEQSTPPDMTKYEAGTVITSNTGQLKWDRADKGFFTINTEGTKGVVGFAQGKTQILGNVTITSQSPFASILLTASSKQATLDKAPSALLSAVARQSNSKFTYSSLDESIIENGDSPLLVEPVQADITLKGREIQQVNVLAQNGTRTNETLPVKNGTFQIDTGKDKTIYYEIIFKK